MANIFSPPLPKLITDTNRPQHISWGGLAGSSPALAIANAAVHDERPIVVVTPDSPSALRLEQEVRFFLKSSTDDSNESSAYSVQLFPDWDVLWK